jgi:hypothetical protein
MLADALTDVSKAKPQRGPVGHRAHARQPAVAEGGGKRRRRRRRRGKPAAGGRHQGRGPRAAAEEEGQGPPLRRDHVRGRGRESGRGVVSGRAAASGRCAASGTEMLVGEGRRRRGRARRRRETALRVCWGGAAHQGGAAWCVREE